MFSFELRFSTVVIYSFGFACLSIKVITHSCFQSYHWSWLTKDVGIMILRLLWNLSHSKLCTAIVKLKLFARHSEVISHWHVTRDSSIISRGQLMVVSIIGIFCSHKFRLWKVDFASSAYCWNGISLRWLMLLRSQTLKSGKNTESTWQDAA